MLKALFLDMDETLCDTQGANAVATAKMAERASDYYGASIDGSRFAKAYLAGIYREWNKQQRQRYEALLKVHSEEAFRQQLIEDLLKSQEITNIDPDFTKKLQQHFDEERLQAFHFYPGIEDFLANARQLFTLVVITNGPEFSQIPKIEAVQLHKHVDHIIIGGQEPEQKPAASIFTKALALAGCEAHEAIHVGDSLAADIAGAHNSGITSVWIQHQQPLDAELGINPHHTVLHPSEIPALIQELHRDGN